jgi:hypothetical protein
MIIPPLAEGSIPTEVWAILVAVGTAGGGVVAALWKVFHGRLEKIMETTAATKEILSPSDPNVEGLVAKVSRLADEMVGVTAALERAAEATEGLDDKVGEKLTKALEDADAVRGELLALLKRLANIENGPRGGPSRGRRAGGRGDRDGP